MVGRASCLSSTCCNEYVTVITPEMIQDFYPDLFGQIHIEGLAHGNLSKEVLIICSLLSWDGDINTFFAGRPGISFHY